MSLHSPLSHGQGESALNLSLAVWLHLSVRLALLICFFGGADDKLATASRTGGPYSKSWQRCNLVTS